VHGVNARPAVVQLEGVSGQVAHSAVVIWAGEGQLDTPARHRAALHVAAHRTAPLVILTHGSPHTAGTSS